VGHKQDWLESLRRRVVPTIGKFISLLEDLLGKQLYHNSQSRNNQFVGRIEMNEEEFERVLDNAGYERNPLAWLKRNSEREIEEGSWRSLDEKMQTHLIFYDGEKAPNANTGELFIYAHYEYRWDVHPWKHLVGEDVSYKDGVEEVRKMLQDEGINYDFIQPG